MTCQIRSCFGLTPGAETELSAACDVEELPPTVDAGPSSGVKLRKLSQTPARPCEDSVCLSSATEPGSRQARLTYIFHSVAPQTPSPAREAGLAASGSDLCWGMIRYRSVTWTLVVTLSALTAAGPAWSDQSDPRLSGLFAQLQAAPSAEAAQPLAARIWGIWMQADDPAADQLMATGVSAMNAGDYRSALDAFGQLVEAKPAFAEGGSVRTRATT